MTNGKNKPVLYSKAPITEAVIEVVFTESVNDSQLIKLSEKLEKKFVSFKLDNHEVQIPLQGQALQHHITKLAAFRLVDKTDPANIVSLKPDAVSVSRLAPYHSWDVFVEFFLKYYKEFTANKRLNIARMGVRFINRLDIPSEESQIKIEDYLTISPKIPEEHLPILADYWVQSSFKLDDSRVMNLNSFLYPEEILLNHLSIVLDIDVVKVNNLPLNHDQLLAELEYLRQKKNFYFEILTTQKSKDLFL